MKRVDTYDDLRKEFSWDKYRDACDWDGRTELNMGHESVDKHRDDRSRVALIWLDEDGTEEPYTFGEITRESNKFANAVTELGVSEGSRVFTHLPRIPEHYASMLGVMKAGAIFGSINERYGVDGVNHRLADSEADTILTTPANLEKIQKATADIDSIEDIVVVDRNDVGYDGDHVDYYELVEGADETFETVRTGPEDPALLYYTSGTTGPAKGVVHGHRFALGNAAFLDQPADLEEDDLYWLTADPGWLTGLNMLGAWFWGVPVVIYAGEFDPEMWVNILNDYPITVLWSVPTAYRMLKDRDELFEGKDIDLRNMLSIGEPLNAPVIEWARERFGTPILDGYGTSETYGTVVSNFPFMEVKPGSMGRPYPGIDVKLVEPGTLEEVEQGEIGEIAVREFPSSFQRYWNRDKETAERIRDGWILTDDLAEMDDDGYFWFQGRADDVILSAGYRIGPFDIESTLVDHESVAEAAVVPKADKQRGNIIVAFVVPSKSAPLDDDLKADIQRFVKEKLAAHEYPRDIRFVDELPKTMTGKIRRTELKEQMRRDKN
ncbi:acyl-CoA synthetase [Halomarina halobia]|uniref:Acyl-CoA synthetase n=1 Tax=Halomarina halobia TaxID=3033386 RepID=A0ABD6AG02_9EURY|nr:AMP-binding protein [Halomarina sp. PSR21]